MTVQELINELMKIKNKNKQVKIILSFELTPYANYEFPYVNENQSYIELTDIPFKERL